MLKENAVEVDSQTMQLKELEKVRGKAKRELEQEAIEDAEEEEFEEEDMDVKEIEIDLSKMGFDKEESLAEELGEKRLEGLRVMTESMQQ